MKRSALLLLALLTLVACSAAAPDILLTGADKGKTVDAVPKQAVIVQLAANASTGFQWTLEGTPSEQVLKLVSQEYRAGESKPGVVGAGGTAILKFEAVGSGTAAVKLVYKRPWVGGETGEAYEFTVRVK